MRSNKKGNTTQEEYKNALSGGLKALFSQVAIFILVLLCSIGITTTPIYANPTGGEVAAGAATISNPSANNLIVNQTSSTAIINWQSFNIGQQESTHFQQPAGGVALNRISPTQGASAIYGQLTATGQIILMNSAGIYFGPSAYVNVGGLIATTANITDQNFLNGIYHFSNVSPYFGSIINQGTIIAADHGLIALIGGNVQNDGFIQANLGHVVLASGNAFTMTFAGNDLIAFSVDEKSSGGIRNTGTLRADGGQILVTANAAAGVLDNVINMKGVVQMRSIGMHHGELILYANAGVVKVSARIEASGKHTGEKGGKVQITSPYILLESSSVIDVSGDIGGGEILLGGNHLGSESLATAIVIAPSATLLADAMTQGNGGNIIVLSNAATKVYGNLSAEGGSLGGNGGYIETSSHDFLDVNGIHVNASAAKGTTGTWSLDPFDVFITTLATSDGSFNSSDPNIFTPSANNSNVAKHR